MLTGLGKNLVNNLKDLKNNIQINTSNIIGTAINKTTQAINSVTKSNSNTIEEIDLSSMTEEKEYKWYEKVGATLCVGATSVVSGVVELADDVTDGVVHLAAGAAEILGKKEAAADMREFITNDWSSELNESLYNKETGVFKEVDKASVLKYDSKAAQWIQAGTKTVAEVTAATLCPGTAVAVFGGFLSGSGKSAEKRYSKEDYQVNFKDEALIGVSGVLGSLQWLANRKIGEGIQSIAKSTKAGGGLFPTVKEIYKDVFNKEFVKTAFKKQLSGFTGVANLANTGCAIAPDIFDFITGDRELNVENVAATVGKGTLYLTTTVLVNELKTYFISPHSYGRFYDPKTGTKTQVLTDELNRLKTGDVSKIMGYTPEQQKMLMDELLANGDSSDDICRVFSKLKSDDATKLLQNISKDSQTQKQVISTLTQNMLRNNKDANLYDDIDDFGTGLQKYILNNLSEKDQQHVAKEIADLYKNGDLEMSQFRQALDKKNPNSQKFLDMIMDNLDSKQRISFDTSLDLSNFGHEVDTVWDKIVKPVSNITAKLITDEEKMQRVNDLLDDAGEFVNRTNTTIQSRLTSTNFWNTFQAARGALSTASDDLGISD